MKELELKGYKITETEFTNKINGSVKLELTHKYNHNVSYSNNGTCRALMKLTVSDKTHPENFSLGVSLEGLFQIKESIPKEKIHVLTYDFLFPFLKAFVSAFSSLSGIPPILIPYVDISDKAIYRVDIPNINGGNLQ